MNKEEYPRTDADKHAEDLADMAYEGGLWEDIRPLKNLSIWDILRDVAQLGEDRRQ